MKLDISNKLTYSPQIKSQTPPKTKEPTKQTKINASISNKHVGAYFKLLS